MTGKDTAEPVGTQASATATAQPEVPRAAIQDQSAYQNQYKSQQEFMEEMLATRNALQQKPIGGVSGSIPPASNVDLEPLRNIRNVEMFPTDPDAMARMFATYDDTKAKMKEQDSEPGDFNFSPFPEKNKFPPWWDEFQCECANKYKGDSKFILKWLAKVRKTNPNGFMELADSEGLLKFDKALATAIMALAKSSVGCSNVKRELELAQRTTLQDGDAAKGRQLLWVMCQKFDLSQEDIANWNLQELMAVKCRNGDLERFSIEWLDALLPYNGQLPPEYLLKDLYENQIVQAQDFDETLKMWKYEVKYKGTSGSYDNMVKLVNKFVEETNRDKVKQATHQSRDMSPHRQSRQIGQYYGHAAPAMEPEVQEGRPAPPVETRGRLAIATADTRGRPAERVGTHVPNKELVSYPRTLSDCNMAKVGICFNWTKEGECPNLACPWMHSHTPELRGTRKGGPKRQNTRSPSSKGTAKGTGGECFKCGSPDHQARYCPQSRAPSVQKGPQNTASAYWQSRDSARVTPRAITDPTSATKPQNAQETNGAQRGRTTSRDSVAPRSQSSHSRFSAATNDSSKSEALKEPLGPSPSGKKNQTICETHLIGRCLGGDRCNSWHSDTCREWKKEKDHKDVKTGEITKGTGVPCKRGARSEGGTCVFCHRNTTSCSGKPYAEPMVAKAKGKGATPVPRGASPAAPSSSGKSSSKRKKKKKKKKMTPKGGLGPMGKKTRKRKIAQQRRTQIREDLINAREANQRGQAMTAIVKMFSSAREMMLRIVLMCSHFVGHGTQDNADDLELEQLCAQEEGEGDSTPGIGQYNTLNRQDDFRRELVESLSGINARNADGTAWDGEFAANDSWRTHPGSQERSEPRWTYMIKPKQRTENATSSGSDSWDTDCDKMVSKLQAMKEKDAISNQTERVGPHASATSASSSSAVRADHFDISENLQRSVDRYCETGSKLHEEQQPQNNPRPSENGKMWWAPGRSSGAWWTPGLCTLPSPKALVKRIMQGEGESTPSEESLDDYVYPDHHGEDQDDAWWVPEPRVGPGACLQWTKNGECQRGDRCPWKHSHSKETLFPHVEPSQPELIVDSGATHELASKFKTKWPGTPMKYPHNEINLPHVTGGQDTGYRSFKADGIIYFENQIPPPPPPYKDGHEEVVSDDSGETTTQPYQGRPPPTGPSPSGLVNRKVCEEHIVGRCANGNTCDFWHSAKCLPWKNEHETQRPCKWGSRQEMVSCVYCHRITHSCSGPAWGTPHRNVKQERHEASTRERGNRDHKDVKTKKGHFRAANKTERVGTHASAPNQEEKNRLLNNKHTGIAHDDPFRVLNGIDLDGISAERLNIKMNRLFGPEADIEMQQGIYTDIQLPYLRNELHNLYWRIVNRSKTIGDIRWAAKLGMDVLRHESRFCIVVGRLLEAGIMEKNLKNLNAGEVCDVRYNKIFVAWVHVACLRYAQNKDGPTPTLVPSSTGGSSTHTKRKRTDGQEEPARDNQEARGGSSSNVVNDHTRMDTTSHNKHWCRNGCGRIAHKGNRCCGPCDVSDGYYHSESCKRDNPEPRDNEETRSRYQCNRCANKCGRHARTGFTTCCHVCTTSNITSHGLQCQTDHPITSTRSRADPAVGAPQSSNQTKENASPGLSVQEDRPPIAYWIDQQIALGMHEYPNHDMAEQETSEGDPTPSAIQGGNFQAKEQRRLALTLPHWLNHPGGSGCMHNEATGEVDTTPRGETEENHPNEVPEQPHTNGQATVIQTLCDTCDGVLSRGEWNRCKECWIRDVQRIVVQIGLDDGPCTIQHTRSQRLEQAMDRLRANPTPRARWGRSGETTMSRSLRRIRERTENERNEPQRAGDELARPAAMQQASEGDTTHAEEPVQQNTPPPTSEVIPWMFGDQNQTQHLEPDPEPRSPQQECATPTISTPVPFRAMFNRVHFRRASDGTQINLGGI